MISNSALATSLPSLTAPSGAFSGLGLAVSNRDGAEQNTIALGVSTAAVPLISAPLSRQSPDFQLAIAPPTRPTNPAIAPPTIGVGDCTLSGSGGMMRGEAAQRAYIPAIRFQMAEPQGSTPLRVQSQFLSALARASTY